MNGWKAAWVEAGRGDAKDFREAGVSAVAPRLRREEPGRLGEQGRWVLLDRQAQRGGRWQENGGAVSADPRRALPGLCLRLRLSLRTPAALTLEGPAGQPSEATSQPGPALAHLTLHQRRRGLHRREPRSSAGREIQLIHGGRGFSARAGRRKSKGGRDLPVGGSHANGVW